MSLRGQTKKEEKEKEDKEEMEEKGKEEGEEGEEREKPGSDGCDEHSWPDRDHGLTCGRCKVLVDRFSDHYKTCSGYCSSLGRNCTGAWEEVGDTCDVAYQTTCNSRIPSSDAICRCTPLGDDAEPLIHGPTGTSEGSLCDEASWPDKDHDLVCGECKVLVNHFSERYSTCDGYCQTLGLKCVGAWEEQGDTCAVSYQMDCFQTAFSSDALCQCSPEAESAASTTTVVEASRHRTTAPPTKRPQIDSQAEVSSASDSGSSLSLGDRVEVRDSAVSSWLPATVTSVSPLRALPDGWLSSYRWDDVRATKGEQVDLNHVTEKPPPSCLCIFDVDRTLTCKQEQASQCAGTKEVSGVMDTAYGGGNLVLSDLARGLPWTFCNACLHGIVSAGVASGDFSIERSALLDALGGINSTLSDKWSPPAPRVSSLLVVGAPDTQKQDSVLGIVSWLREHKGVHIERGDVYFFDDNDLNVPPFEGTGFNARQISCGSRDGIVGFCGGLAREVVSDAGVRPCQRKVR